MATMPSDPAARPRAGLRLMHVHAHPDDESSKGAASTAMYVAQGVDVHVVTCTGGERGSILNPKMERPDIEANITEVRRQEMERARDILGVRQDWLGFVDSGWPDGDPKPPLPDGCFALVPLEEAAAPLVRLMREFRPHVVTTYDERGGYPHPDHVMCHQVSVAAFEAAGDPERYPDLGEPWQPLKLYYHHSFNRPRMQALHEAMIAHDLESPWADRLAEWKPEPEWDARITTRVPCADYFGVRDQALLAHATQIDPDGPWFAIPRELQERVWPTEDFELVTSHVRHADARGRPVRRYRPRRAPGHLTDWSHDCGRGRARAPAGDRADTGGRRRHGGTLGRDHDRRPGGGRGDPDAQLPQADASGRPGQGGRRVRRRADAAGPPGPHGRRGPPFSSLRRHAGGTGTLVRCSAPPDLLR